MSEETWGEQKVFFSSWSLYKDHNKDRLQRLVTHSHCVWRNECEISISSLFSLPTKQIDLLHDKNSATRNFCERSFISKGSAVSYDLGIRRKGWENEQMKESPFSFFLSLFLMRVNKICLLPVSETAFLCHLLSFRWLLLYWIQCLAFVLLFCHINTLDIYLQT